MRESEKTLERKLSRLVKERGGYCFKFLPMHVNGIPDRICLLPGGRMFFAEMKSTGDKADPLQKVWHKRLRRLGFDVHVIDNSDYLNEVLQTYDA